MYLASQANNNDEQKPLPQHRRQQKFWRKSKKHIASIALALSFLRSPAAYASVTPAELVDKSARANDLMIESLRPGASKEDAEMALDMDTVVLEKTEVNTGAKSKKDTVAASKKKLKTKKKAKQLYYDDEEDDLDDEDIFGEEDTAMEAAAKSKSTPKTTTSSDIYFKSSETSKSTYVKATFIFITLPVLLFGGIETYKRRSESVYVKKALKIQAMKKQEHMTETQKEAERLAAEAAENGDEDDDEEDDDEDEDDDDDEEDDDDDFDEPPKPKKPSGDDGDGGDDAPSADDIDRLNKLMGRQ